MLLVDHGLPIGPQRLGGAGGWLLQLVPGNRRRAVGCWGDGSAECGGWQEEPGHRIIADAFALAGHAGTQCRPVYLLQALPEADEPIGETLEVLRPAMSDRPGRLVGAGSTYVFGQTQGAAANFAAVRGEPMDARHLLVALVDQSDPERMLSYRVGFSVTKIRSRMG